MSRNLHIFTVFNNPLTHNYQKVTETPLYKKKDTVQQFSNAKIHSSTQSFLITTHHREIFLYFAHYLNFSSSLNTPEFI